MSEEKQTNVNKNLKVNKKGKVVVDRYSAITLPGIIKCHGSKPSGFLNVLNKIRKFNSQELIDWINFEAKEGQKNVYKHIQSDKFRNISNWVYYLSQKKDRNQSSNELSIIFDVIAAIEDHPKIDENNSIDFEELYKCLGDLMMGRPTGELKEASKEYLKQTFNDIQSDILSSDIRHKTEIMKHLVENIPEEEITDRINYGEKRDLIKLQTVKKQDDSLVQLNDENMNPFNFPENLLNVDDDH